EDERAHKTLLLRHSLVSESCQQRNSEGFPASQVFEKWDSTSLPKNRCPHPHAGRALSDRHLEVMRHAHRQHIHTDRRQLARRNLISQLAQLLEIRARLLRVLGKGRKDRKSV